MKEKFKKVKENTLEEVNNPKDHKRRKIRKQERKKCRK